MPDDASLQSKLKESQQSRIRGWQALKGLRGIINSLSDDPLPPPSKPPCFETEGALLKSTVLKTLAHLRRDIENMNKAASEMWPYIGTKDADGAFPQANIQFNRALAKLDEWCGTLAFMAEKNR